MTFETLANQFYEYLEIKGYREITRRGYRQNLLRFLRYLSEHEVNTLDQITPKVVYEYQTGLYYATTKDGEPLSVHTQLAALTTVKTFFLFLRETEKIVFDPAAGLSLPSHPKRLPRVMTPEEVMKLLSLPDTLDVIGFRNRTIMEVLYITGMRARELCHLKLSDIDLSNEEIHIREGKGGKERIVPVGEIALDFIKEYLQSVRPKLLRDVKEAWLFLSRGGKRILEDDLNRMITAYAKKAELVDVTTHTFRHTCATHLLQGGADVRYIQALLGHESIISTQIYTHVAIEDLKEVHQKYHPRERLAGGEGGDDVE
jgi:integrase/recombinase XerD